MKKIFLICITCIVLLCGCSAAKIEKANETQESVSMFVEVEQASFWKIVYHKDSKVMYAISEGSYNRGTFTLLVNADGTPMIYEGGDKEEFENQCCGCHKINCNDCDHPTEKGGEKE